jgi:hypothetical protein
MAMELLSFHDQLVAVLASDNQDDDFIALDIIKGTQVSRPQLKFGERIRTQAFDCICSDRGLLLEPGHDRRFQVSPITRW